MSEVPLYGVTSGPHWVHHSYAHDQPLPSCGGGVRHQRPSLSTDGFIPHEAKKPNILSYTNDFRSRPRRARPDTVPTPSARRSDYSHRTEGGRTRHILDSQDQILVLTFG